MNQYPCTESGAKEAESCGDAMPATEDHGKTACNASVDAWRATECNNRNDSEYECKGERSGGSEFV